MYVLSLIYPWTLFCFLRLTLGMLVHYFRSWGSLMHQIMLLKGSGPVLQMALRFLYPLFIVRILWSLMDQIHYYFMAMVHMRYYSYLYSEYLLVEGTGIFMILFFANLVTFEIMLGVEVFNCEFIIAKTRQSLGAKAIQLHKVNLCLSNHYRHETSKC